MMGFENNLAQMILTLCIDFSATCSFRLITLLCMVGFQNNLAQMIVHLGVIDGWMTCDSTPF